MKNIRIFQISFRKLTTGLWKDKKKKPKTHPDIFCNFAFFFSVTKHCFCFRIPSSKESTWGNWQETSQSGIVCDWPKTGGLCSRRLKPTKQHQWYQWCEVAVQSPRDTDYTPTSAAACSVCCHLAKDREVLLLNRKPWVRRLLPWAVRWLNLFSTVIQIHIYLFIYLFFQNVITF